MNLSFKAVYCFFKKSIDEKRRRVNAYKFYKNREGYSFTAGPVYWSMTNAR